MRLRSTLCIGWGLIENQNLQLSIPYILYSPSYCELLNAVMSSNFLVRQIIIQTIIEHYSEHYNISFSVQYAKLLFLMILIETSIEFYIVDKY